MDAAFGGVKFEAGGVKPYYQAAEQDFGIASFRWLRSAPLDFVGMSAAVVTVAPGVEWAPHRHSAYEQIIYVISGRAKHAIDGRWDNLVPRAFAHVPHGSTHELINHGTEPLVFLAVYNPIQLHLQLPVSRQISTPPELVPELRKLISAGVLQRIQDSLAEAAGTGALLVDQNGVGATEPSNLPGFCRLVRQSGGACRLASGPGGASVVPAGAGGDSRHFFDCCCGVTGLSVPITLDGHCVGAAVAGFALLEAPSVGNLVKVRELAVRAGLDPKRLLTAYRAIPVVLGTPLRAAADSLQAAVSSLMETAAREARERLLREFHERLSEETNVVRDLEVALAKTERRLLQAQFSPHFLFNALNMIAASITAGEPEPERMVYALSDFLRYVLQSRESLVPLGEEITCVRNYLTIQQNRFGKNLKVDVQVPPGLEEYRLPSLILQPLVENAVIHGLGPRRYEGTITVTARVVEGDLEVEVRDDGVGLPGDLLLDSPQAALTSREVAASGLGLRLVRQKLELYYGEEGRLSIASDRERGTRAVLRLPRRAE